MTVFFRFIFLLLAALTMIQGSLAQPGFKVHWGKEYEDEEGKEILALFGSNDDWFYCLRENRKKRDGFTVQKISTDSLRVEGSITFNLPPVNELFPQLAYPISIGSRTYLLATADDPTNENVYIYAYEILEPLNLKPTPELLGIGIRSVMLDRGGFSRLSNSSNDRMALWFPLENTPGKNAKFEFRLFDPTLKLINSKSLEVPYECQQFDLKNGLVDSLGNIYALAEISTGSIKLKDPERMVGKEYSLFKYDWEKGALTEKSFSLGNKWIYDLRITENRQGNILVTGFYSNMIDLIIAGVFSLEIDKNSGEIIDKGLSPFERNLRANFKPGFGRGAGSEAGVFELRFAYPSGNQSGILVSEKTYSYNSTVFNPVTGMYTTTTVYNFDEILVSKLSPSGKTLFNWLIPKFQSSTSYFNGYTSYYSFAKGDDLFLIYNDNDRNAELGLNEESNYRQLTTPNNSKATLVHIDPSGKAGKYTLDNPFSNRTVLDAGLNYITPNIAVFGVINGYRTQYLKVSMK